MGRHKSDRSESPVKGHRSPKSRSPSYRQRSPVHRNSQREHLSAREKHYGRTKSPRQPRSRSPVSRSPVREKASTHTKSSSHARSKSPVPRSLMKEKPSSRTRSPKHPKSRSHVSRSPSPRTKRLGRLQAEREDQKVSERDYERNHGKATDRAAHRDKDSGQDLPIERKERRSQKDSVDNGSSRLRPERSISPADCHRRSRHVYRSPPAAANRTCDEVKRSRGAEHHNGDSDSLAKMKAAEEVLNTNEKQKPSFELSGKLAAETNRVRGVTLLFTEPAEARKPDVRWRLYVFKGGEVLNEPLYIHRQSCYLFGRERRVADIPTDHPSCSKQHAVLQYRQVEKEQLDGTSIKQVRPYLMDLGSTNGTFIHDNRIEPQRYYEIFEKDTIKFGNSSREYVLLHENSADDGH